MEENELISVDNNNAVEYTDDNIRHLSDMEHVRTRPGMYIGRLGDGAHDPVVGLLATLGMAAGTAVTVTLLAVLSQRARHLSQRLLARRHPAADSLQLASQGVALLGGLLLCGLGISLMLAPTSLLLPR